MNADVSIHRQDQSNVYPFAIELIVADALAARQAQLNAGCPRPCGGLRI
jgi:hypothetical protein